MPTWLTAIATLLGSLGPIETLLSALGVFVTEEVAKLYGNAPSGAAVYLEGLIKEIEDGVQLLDNGMTNVEAEVTTLWPDIQSLLAAFPGLGQSLLLRNQVIQSSGVSHGTAAKLVEVAHANVRVASKTP